MNSNFIFTTCQIGSETYLKNELREHHPDFHFAYSKAGFLTFKTQKPISEDFKLKSLFTRAYGVSLGPIEKLNANALPKKLLESPIFLHIWAVDTYPPGVVPPEVEFQERSISENEHTHIRTTLKDLGFKISDTPTSLILDVIRISKSQEKTDWWIGFHQDHSEHSKDPGAIPPFDFLKPVPSRAYFKLEEMLLRSGIELKPKETALEVGAAPGGACLYLLEEGLHVTGIDSAAIDHRVSENPHFKHIQKSFKDLQPNDLSPSYDWLLVDINTDPRVTLHCVTFLGKSGIQFKKGMFLTLKLNSSQIVSEIPWYLDEIKGYGYSIRLIKQLFSHRKEFGVVISMSRMS